MSDGDRSYWDKHAKNYDRSMSLLGRPIRRMVELVGEATRGLQTVLEVAAGNGIVTPALAAGAREVIATDCSAAMVDALQRRILDAGLSNVRCEQVDLYALRFDDGTFDAVVAANVLHLLPDLPGALVALRRVLRRGGRVVVPTFCHDETALSWVASRALAVTGFPGHQRFSARSLRQAVEDAGVCVTRTETLPGLIPIGYVEGGFEWPLPMKSGYQQARVALRLRGVRGGASPGLVDGRDVPCGGARGADWTTRRGRA